MSDEIGEIHDTADFEKVLNEFRVKYMKSLKRAMFVSAITTAFFAVMMVLYFSVCFGFGCSVTLTDIVLFAGGLALVSLVNAIRVRVDADSKFMLIMVHIARYTLDIVKDKCEEGKPHGRPKKAK